MSNLSISNIELDTTNAANSSNVGAYVRSDDGTFITHTTDGAIEALDVAIVGTANSGIYEEDSAHTTADRGQFILAVQTATQGGLADDGDYAPMQVDPEGRLRVLADFDLTGNLVGDDEADTEDPLKVGSHAYDQASAWGTVDAGDKANLASDLYRRVLINDAPNVGLANAATAVDDTIGGTNLMTALAGRTRAFIQNLGPRALYVGATGVTTATGLKIDKNATWSLELGESIDIFGITDAGAALDVRHLQLA